MKDDKPALKSKKQPNGIEAETTVPKPIMNKVIEATKCHVLDKILWSQSFLNILWIALHATSQEQGNEINAQISLLSDPEEFKITINEHRAELKPKWNTNTSKRRIIESMNALIYRLNKMESRKSYGPHSVINFQTQNECWSDGKRSRRSN